MPSELKMNNKNSTTTWTHDNNATSTATTLTSENVTELTTLNLTIPGLVDSNLPTNPETRHRRETETHQATTITAEETSQVLESQPVCRLEKKILYPAHVFDFKKPVQMILQEVFHEPYFMLYGEVYAFTIDPCFGPEAHLHQCNVGSKFIPFLMALFLLLSNVLMLNLLIAVFNSTYQEIKKNAMQLWKYDQYGRVTELEDAPYCPPPLVIFEQIWYLYKKLTRKRSKYGRIDKGLKLFLEENDVANVQSFEEDNMASLSRIELNQNLKEEIEKSNMIAQRHEERVDKITHRMGYFMESIDVYLNEMLSEREELIKNVLLKQSASGRPEERDRERDIEINQATEAYRGHLE